MFFNTKYGKYGRSPSVLNPDNMAVFSVLQPSHSYGPILYSEYVLSLLELRYFCFCFLLCVYKTEVSFQINLNDGCILSIKFLLN